MRSIFTVEPWFVFSCRCFKGDASQSPGRPRVWQEVFLPFLSFLGRVYPTASRGLPARGLQRAGLSGCVFARCATIWVLGMFGSPTLRRFSHFCPVRFSFQAFLCSFHSIQPCMPESSRKFSGLFFLRCVSSFLLCCLCTAIQLLCFSLWGLWAPPCSAQGCS